MNTFLPLLIFLTFPSLSKLPFPSHKLYITENKGRCMNLSEGIGVNTIYGRGKGAWIKREKQEI